MLKSALRLAVLAATSTLLTACGGGGGDSAPPAATTPTPVTQAALQGVFTGSIQGSPQASTFDLLTLDTGQFWVLYGNTDATNTFLVSGLLEGTGSSNGTEFTSGDLRDLGVFPAAAGTLAATFSADAISGSATEAGGTVTFSGTRPQQSAYVYDTPADLTAISGAWNVISVGGGPTSLTVSANGTFTGTQSGCSFSGSLTPHGQKNVFDVVVTFGAAPCALPGQTGAGVALDFQKSAGRQLIVALVNSDRTRGSILLGLR